MHIQSLGATASSLNQEPVETPSQAAHKSASLRQEPSGQGLGVALKSTPGILSGKLPESVSDGHCCKVSDEAAFCLIQRPYISKTLLTRRISPRGSP